MDTKQLVSFKQEIKRVYSKYSAKLGLSDFEFEGLDDIDDPIAVTFRIWEGAKEPIVTGDIEALQAYTEMFKSFDKIASKYGCEFSGGQELDDNIVMYNFEEND